MQPKSLSCRRPRWLLYSLMVAFALCLCAGFAAPTTGAAPANADAITSAESVQDSDDTVVEAETKTTADATAFKATFDLQAADDSLSAAGFDPTKGKLLEPAHYYLTQDCINLVALVGVGYDFTDYHDSGIRDKCRSQYERSFSVAIYWRLITDFPSNGTIYNLIKSYPKYVDEFEESLSHAWMVMAYFKWQEGPYEWKLGACMYEHHDGTLYLLTPSVRRGSDGYPYHAVTIRRVEKHEMATIYEKQVNCNN